MSIDEKIVAAVSPIVPEVYPIAYEGNDLTFCTFNYSEIRELHASSKPHRTRYLVQLHLLLPAGAPCAELKLRLCRALYHAGFTYPGIENASDSSQQHYVLECEGKDGIPDGDF